MARGITSFRDFRKWDDPAGTHYGCRHCDYSLIRQHRFRGNALGAHVKAVAAIKYHTEEQHPEVKP